MSKERLENPAVRVVPLEESLTFVVPGPPVPCARARVAPSRKTGKMRAVTPGSTRAYEERVRVHAMAAVAKARWKPRAGGYVVGIVVERVARRGDWDNYAKAVCDACNGILWPDDRCIVEAHVVLGVNADNPRTIVKVERRGEA
jgi:Holliday junction resolvase RusA-like endonuclease